jgi:asparagine synthase (glutamine-hydrolysing)
MCGIAGLIWHKGETLGAVCEAMIGTMRHRGPDGQGTVRRSCAPTGGQVVLGAARLAIIDPGPGGDQPFHDPRTDSWLVFNGEIYNHREIRDALDGVRWHSRSDTETVLQAYLAWGPACLERFRGMFALAVWDGRDASLWCARDRLGIKPLYYFAAPDGFLFASEVRALLRSGLVPRTLDRTGLDGYARFGALPEPGTLIAGVRSLPAATWLRVHGLEIEGPRTYWRPACPEGPAPPASVEVIAPGIEAALRRAVNEHLAAETPIGCFLSGGLDSSVVTALAAPANLRTFTLGFADPRFDESRHAEAVAAYCGTRHLTVRLDDRIVSDQVRGGVEASDSPSADAINTYLIARAAAAAGIKVVLSGLGADELFGGYPTFSNLPQIERLAALLATRPGASPRPDLDLLGLDRSRSERHDRLRAYWSDEDLRALGFDPHVRYGDWDPPDQAPAASAVSVLELSGYMRSMLLRDGDGMTMACSIELRLPFLDHELVDLCLKSQAARWAAERPKPVLRHIAAPLLPAATIEGGKRGFELPMGVWMQGCMREFCLEGLDLLRDHGALPDEACARADRALATGDPRWRRVWQWVVLGHWLDAHFR